MSPTAQLLEYWTQTLGQGPMSAVALHAGHELRDELQPLIALSDSERLREEDPYTDRWTEVAPTRLAATHSRFEVDLNRPREEAVYQTPAQSWGLRVWRRPLPRRVVARSLEEYDEFYHNVGQVLTDRLSDQDRVVMLDLHSYNHRRDGAAAMPADPSENPEVNLGTGSLQRDKWGPVVERFIHDLSEFDFDGRHLDVRENVRFQGGHFSHWVHDRFPDVCVLAVEFKKFFMDEWTGLPDEKQIALITDALDHAAEGVRRELNA